MPATQQDMAQLVGKRSLGCFAPNKDHLAAWICKTPDSVTRIGVPRIDETPYVYSDYMVSELPTSPLNERIGIMHPSESGDAIGGSRDLRVFVSRKSYATLIPDSIGTGKISLVGQLKKDGPIPG